MLMLANELQIDLTSYISQALKKGVYPVKTKNPTKFMDWIDQHYRLPVSNRAPEGKLLFDDRPYLREIYKCDNQYIIIMKAAQVGMSERFIAESLYRMDQFNANILYTFPAAEQIGNFVSGRVNPVIECSSHIQNLMKKGRYQKDDIGMKQIAGRFIYFRGSQNRNQIITIDADMVVIDERDSMIQNNVDTIKKRVLSSAYQWIRELSTPSYVDFGIHAAYLESDQRVWMIKCPACGKEQFLSFPQNFRMDPPADGYWCTKHGCDGQLDPLIGYWVKLNPQSDIAGFHVPGMLNPRVSAMDIIKAFKNPKTNFLEFYWQTLGNPYDPEGSKMTREILNACRTTEGDVLRDTGKHCRMGVDVGKVLHVRVSELQDDRKIARFIGTVKDFDDLDALMNRYDVDVCVVDMDPEPRSVKRFADRFPGRVYMARFAPLAPQVCEYPDPRRRRRSGEEYIPLIKVDRTLALDEAHQEIERRGQVLPANLEAIEDFYDQMCALTKVSYVDPKTGNKKYKYVGGTVDEHGKETGGQPDHYMLASVYEYIAWLGQSYRSGQRKARILG